MEFKELEDIRDDSPVIQNRNKRLHSFGKSDVLDQQMPTKKRKVKNNKLNFKSMEVRPGYFKGLKNNKDCEPQRRNSKEGHEMMTQSSVIGIKRRSSRGLPVKMSNIEYYKKIKVQRVREFSMNKKLHDELKKNGSSRLIEEQKLKNFDETDRQNNQKIENNLNTQRKTITDRLKSRKERSISRIRNKIRKSQNISNSCISQLKKNTNEDEIKVDKSKLLESEILQLNNEPVVRGRIGSHQKTALQNRKQSHHEKEKKILEEHQDENIKQRNLSIESGTVKQQQSRISKLMEELYSRKKSDSKNGNQLKDLPKKSQSNYKKLNLMKYESTPLKQISLKKKEFKLSNLIGRSLKKPKHLLVSSKKFNTPIKEQEFLLEKNQGHINKSKNAMIISDILRMKKDPLKVLLFSNIFRNKNIIQIFL